MATIESTGTNGHYNGMNGHCNGDTEEIIVNGNHNEQQLVDDLITTTTTVNKKCVIECEQEKLSDSCTATKTKTTTVVESVFNENGQDKCTNVEITQTEEIKLDPVVEQQPAVVAATVEPAVVEPVVVDTPQVEVKVADEEKKKEEEEKVIEETTPVVVDTPVEPVVVVETPVAAAAVVPVVDEHSNKENKKESKKKEKKEKKSKKTKEAKEANGNGTTATPTTTVGEANGDVSVVASEGGCSTSESSKVKRKQSFGATLKRLVSFNKNDKKQKALQQQQQQQQQQQTSNTPTTTEPHQANGTVGGETKIESVVVTVEENSGKIIAAEIVETPAAVDAGNGDVAVQPSTEIGEVNKEVNCAIEVVQAGNGDAVGAVEGATANGGVATSTDKPHKHCIII